MRQVGNVSRKSIQRLLNVLNIEGKLEMLPGFAHALCLSPGRLKPDYFAHNDKTMTFRYTVSSSLMLSKLDTNITLSTYLAILYDVTTWAFILDKPRNRRRGVPASMQAEWGHASQLGMYPGAVVDITTTITKSSSNAGHVRAEVRDADTGQLVCFGSHTKTLPVGKLLDFLASPVGERFLRVYAKHLRDEPIGHTCQMDNLFNSLDFETHTQAFFVASPAHLCSAGSIHGGCQAILMELVGRQVAQDELAAPWVRLDSIQVNYTSSAAEKLQIDAELIKADRLGGMASIRIVLKRASDGGVVSEGVLSFTDRIEFVEDKNAPAILKTAPFTRRSSSSTCTGSLTTATNRYWQTPSLTEF